MHVIALSSVCLAAATVVGVRLGAGDGSANWRETQFSASSYLARGDTRAILLMPDPKPGDPPPPLTFSNTGACSKLGTSHNCSSSGGSGECSAGGIGQVQCSAWEASWICSTNTGWCSSRNAWDGFCSTHGEEGGRCSTFGTGTGGHCSADDGFCSTTEATSTGECTANAAGSHCSVSTGDYGVCTAMPPANEESCSVSSGGGTCSLEGYTYGGGLCIWQ